MIHFQNESTRFILMGFQCPMSRHTILQTETVSVFNFNRVIGYCYYKYKWERIDTRKLKSSLEIDGLEFSSFTLEYHTYV